MIENQNDIRNIYLGQMTEVRDRLHAAENFGNAYLESNDRIAFDCSVLQLRKALEATAYASIAPNKSAYVSFREHGKTPQNFAKDYHASKILQSLQRINKDFYPKPLRNPVRQPDGTVHYEAKKDNFLTEKKFINIYDRLGKFLHADNPWDNDKQRQNLANVIPEKILELRELLLLHATFIRAPSFNGVLIVELPLDSRNPTMAIAEAKSDFLVK